METFVQNLLMVLMENLIEILFMILSTLVAGFFAWVMSKVGKREELEGIAAATENVANITAITIGELQQTVVNDLKAIAEDGKLSAEEIQTLNRKLIDKTLEKMSDPVFTLLNNSGVDVIALIKGAGEDWINSLKEGK